MRLPTGWKKAPPLRVKSGRVFPEINEYRHTSGARVISLRGLEWNLYRPNAHEPMSSGMDGAELARTYNAAAIA